MSAAEGTVPITWDYLRGYNPAGDVWRGGWGNQSNARQHLLNWVGDAQRYAASKGYGLSGDQINEIARFGTGDMAADPASGFNAAAYGGEVNSHKLNPGQTVEAVLAGHRASEAPGSWGTGSGAQGGATTSMYDFLGRQLDPTQQLFYQTNPQLAYAYAGSRFSPNAASPRRDWWDQNWGQFNAEYGNASVDNQNLQITDFLNQRFPQMAQAFDLLPAAQRGVNAPYLPAGRPQL
jgi:hypothetical protein